MNLHSGYPYWLMKSGLLHEYPSLQEDSDTDIAILGGGITGALICWHLREAGKQVLLVDGRHIGMGSTCASTSMLQYEIDEPLSGLQEKVGPQDALRSYQLCIEAVNALEWLTKRLGVPVEFERKPSLYFASRRADLPGLRKEFAARKALGIELEWLERAQLEQRFGFAKAGAIYSPANSAQLDAYALTHALLQSAIRSGARVYDKTRIERISEHRGGVELHSTYGKRIRARTLIMANGYEVQPDLPPGLVKLHSTYALVSEPYPQEQLWRDDALIWETARPYLYMRSTRDSRILVGGLDEPFFNPARRDALIPAKTKRLVKAFEKLFPDLGPLRVDFSWAGTFAETPDGLPYIGRLKNHPHTCFALGFGGNGILFSLIAARILSDLLCGKQNADARIFSFERCGLKS